MISEAVGAMASVFALSFPENFPHHRVRHLWELQHVRLLLFLGCSRLLGKPDTGGKQKAKPKKACFPPLGHLSHYYSPLLPLSSQTGGTL